MQFGSGLIQAGSWSPDGKLFAIHTFLGNDLYNTQTQEFIGTVDDAAQVSLWEAAIGQNPVVSETIQLMGGDYNEGQPSPIWDVESGELLRTVDVPHGQALVKFSHQGDQVIFQGNDGYFRIGDVHDPNLDRVLEAEISSLTLFVFSPDDRILASSSDNLVRLWDVATGKLLHELPQQYKSLIYYGHHNLAIAFSPDGRHLAIVTESAALVFDVVSGEQAYSLGNYFTPGLAYSPDGSTLFTAGGYDVYAWDAHSGQLLQTWASTVRVRAVAISPDSQLMAWGGGHQQYKVQMWDRMTGQLLYTVEQEGHPIYGLVFSPDGQMLATTPAEFRPGQVWLWEANSGRPLYNFPGDNVAFSPDGRLLVTSIPTNTFNDTIEVREASSGKLLFSFPGLSLTLRTPDGGYRQPVAFSPDGRFLANAYIEPDAHSVELWDTTTFEIVRRFESSTLIGFNPDGDMLVLSSGQGKPYLEWWDVDSGALLDSIQRQDWLNGCIALSPDGRFGLGGASNLSYHQTWLVCWDLNSDRHTWFSGSVGTGMFSPDGRSLTTIDDNDILHLWSLPPGP
jgi:WD40 repeat protein